MARKSKAKIGPSNEMGQQITAYVISDFMYSINGALTFFTAGAYLDDLKLIIDLANAEMPISINYPENDSH